MIRPATKEDLPACEQIGQIKEFKNPYEEYANDAKFMENYLDENFFLVAEDDDEIIGYIIGEELKGKGVMIWYVTVKEKMRGKGVGKKLLLEFEKRDRKSVV